MALWTQVATGSGTGAGLDMPTHVTLSNSFVLNAGTFTESLWWPTPQLRSTTPTALDRIKNYSNVDLSLALDPLRTCRSPRLSSRLAYGTGDLLRRAVQRSIYNNANRLGVSAEHYRYR